tara:strand:+ start:87 stop:668 length:582 start_codon:yes stop_codon:yes gene_type:complete
MNLFRQTNWRQVQEALSTPIAKATPLIPLAGYSIIFGDFFHELWSFDQSLGTEAAIFQSWRPKCFYFGLVFIALSQIIFWCRANRIARLYSDAADFQTKLGAFLHRSRGEHDHRSCSQLNAMLLSVDLPVAGEEYIASDSIELAENCRRLFQYYDERDPWSATICWFLILLGLALLAIPACDLFIRVVLATFG